MKITVVKPDTYIKIDGSGVSRCNMESKDFWALHYDTETGGEIEFTDRNEPLNSDLDIEQKTGVSLSEWKTRKDTRFKIVMDELNNLGNG